MGDGSFSWCDELRSFIIGKKLDYSKDKVLVGELLSVAMRGGGHKGVLGTILSYV